MPLTKNYIRKINEFHSETYKLWINLLLLVCYFLSHQIAVSWMKCERKKHFNFGSLLFPQMNKTKWFSCNQFRSNWPLAIDLFSLYIYYFTKSFSKMFNRMCPIKVKKKTNKRKKKTDKPNWKRCIEWWKTSVEKVQVENFQISRSCI